MKTHDEYLGLAKSVAERQADALATNTFMPTIAFHVEDDLLRLLAFPRIEDAETRNQLSYALAVLAAGIDNLETTVFTMDTYHSTHPTKKNGEPWGVGGMQYAVENNTEDADLVTDALSMQIMSVNGDRAMATVPYVKKNGGVEIDMDGANVIVHGQEGQLKGFFVEIMEQAFGAPKLMAEMQKLFGGPEVFDLTKDQARIHSMAIAVKMVMRQTGMRILIPAHSPEEQERIKNSMEGGPFSEGIAAFDQDQINEIVTLEEAFEQPSFIRDLGLTNRGDVTKEE